MLPISTYPRVSKVHSRAPNCTAFRRFVRPILVADAREAGRVLSFVFSMLLSA